ncbi:NADPH-dependent FMN reductase [Marinomonas lutimaris]|jgi:chromate reductase|uniref:NADPH-dependent FMN reductase n=1 Tax=Marinomonas lutimaris TaxID=2846746 RepID=UPI001C66BF57|nr:NADPH-dependent FMN reductase [Marinomonas lutimaris]
MKILLLSGSFSNKSKSLAILNTIEALLTNHSTETPRLDTLPFYNDDLNADKPADVQAFIDSVDQADGIILCTPEYNHSVPAVLKNALDWASRPAFNSPLKNKPVTIITQADSPVGGARAQAHLKLIMDAILSDIHICHEMMLTPISKLVSDGKVTDETALRRLERHTKDFLNLIESRKA